MKKSRLLAAANAMLWTIALLLVAAPVNASTLTVFHTGILSSRDTDLVGLDGASYSATWSFDIDTPDATFESPPYLFYSSYNGILDFEISNISNPVSTISSSLVGVFRIRNEEGILTDDQILTTSPFMLRPFGEPSTIYAGINLPALRMSFGGNDYFTGQTSPLFSDLDLADATLDNTQLAYRTGSTGPFYYYDLSNQTFSYTLTSTVPLPAAVWLFTSGLLGLIGITRRKSAA